MLQQGGILLQSVNIQYRGYAGDQAIVHRNVSSACCSVRNRNMVTQHSWSSWSNLMAVTPPYCTGRKERLVQQTKPRIYVTSWLAGPDTVNTVFDNDMTVGASHRDDPHDVLEY